MAGQLGTPVKNFFSCPFSLTIPSLLIYEDRAVISTTLQPKQSSCSEGFVLDYCQIIGKNGATFVEKPLSCYMPASKKTKTTIEVAAPNKQIVYTGATVSIGILTLSGCRAEITYSCDIKKILTFEHVKCGSMDKEDQDRFTNVFNKYLSLAQAQPVPTPDPKPLPTTNLPSTISQYIDAVTKERNYLKHQGGRKYKVTNGRRISSVGGVYSYLFDLETELYLSDDSPIKLTTGGGLSATGNVLLCEGFKITVILQSDLGTKIGSAHISVEPWRLLDSLTDRLSAITKADVIAMKLLNEGPSLSSNKPIELIATGQDAAIKRASGHDITVIWGPPGTGKTHTMAEIAINAISSGKKVLVVSHSNISVDGVVLKVAELLEKKHLQHYLSKGHVLRYGYVRDESLSKNDLATSFNYALNRSPTLKDKMSNISKQKEKLKGQPYSEAHVILEQEIKKIRTLLHDEERVYVKKAQFVATTVSKLYADKLFESCKYDVVMFDEVSMAYVPQIICAASYARQHLICVGDFRQLAPISQSDAKNVLQKDLFTFLNISTPNGDIRFHPWLVLLNEQRRMDPAISAFPSKTIYRGLLKDHPSVVGSRTTTIKKKPFANHALTLFDTSGTYSAAGKNNDNSRYNVLNAITSFLIAVAAEHAGEKSVAIITPYAAQTRLIRALIQDYRKDNDTTITCSTVHQFQGSERNVIVFDAVESYPSKQVGWLMSKNENNSLTRLINVAITRARGKLVVVAHRGFWLKKFEGTSNALYLLIRHILSKGNIVDVKSKQVQELYHNADVGNGLGIYSDISKAKDAVIADIARAKHKVICSLPDQKMNPSAADSIFQAFISAVNRGVDIGVKTKVPDDLPKKWQSYTAQSERALFPLIIIDDKTLWYGYPLTAEQFQDGNTGYATVAHAIIRIKGENTIEMVKSLTEIDGVTSSAVHATSQGPHSGGLSKYIEHKEFCPICKNHFKLVKNPKTGKSFLRCSNPQCGKTKPLDLQLVKWYINQHDIRCPKHSCPLTVHSGQYGQYLHCEHGHNLKLSDI